MITSHQFFPISTSSLSLLEGDQSPPSEEDPPEGCELENMGNWDGSSREESRFIDGSLAAERE